MAGGIKGIVVKIGGDTTQLGKALSDATTKSNALQKELKGVNTLLKYDPKNVNLLKQKQDLLKSSIEQTKKKLEALVETQKKVDAKEIEMSEDEYRNLQREIANTENKLRNLENENKKFGSVGVQQISAYGAEMQKVGSKVEDTGKKLSGLSTITGAVLGGSVFSASKYEDSLAKVHTIADTSKKSMGSLSKEIMHLSDQTGTSADAIANATYDAISAGQDTANAVSFVKNATSLAKAGFTETGSAIDVLTTIMNAYGLKSSEVGKVSDMLIQTQNKGKTTVAELSSTMGKVIPTAHSMNVGLDQLCAGYSIMTAKGIATAESTTYMNSMLNELGKSGTKVSTALKQKTGKSFQDLMKDGNSLGDVLQILKDYANETGTNFNDLWSSSEAGKAGLTLLSDGVDSFNSAVDGMNKSTGTTAEAMKKLDTPSTKAKKAINQLKNAGISLGQTALVSLTPVINSICNAIKNLTKWFTGLSPGVQQVILVILGLVTALAPVLIIVGKVISAIGTIMTLAPMIVSAITAIGGAFKLIGAIASANPLGAIIIVITALVSALIYAYNHCETFKNIVNTAFNTIRSVVGAVVSALVGFFTGTIPSAFAVFANTVTNIITGVASVIGSVLGGIGSVVGTIFSVIAIVVTTVWGTIKNATINTWNGIKMAVTHPITSLKSIVSSTVNGIKSTITTVWHAIKAVTATVWGGIKAVIINPIQSAWKTITSIINRIRNTVKGIFNGIKPKLPISLPHISVSGGKPPFGIGGMGKLPSFDVKWNKMGAIFDKPTIFNTPYGLQGVGEAGAEAVAPITELMKYVQTAVDNSDMTNRLDRLETIVSTGFANMNRKSQIVLDTGVLVGETIDKIDAELADKQLLSARGV
jgi:TP901 family phage tail tape measure protein